MISEETHSFGGSDGRHLPRERSLCAPASPASPHPGPEFTSSPKSSKAGLRPHGVEFVRPEKGQGLYYPEEAMFPWERG